MSLGQECTFRGKKITLRNTCMFNRMNVGIEKKIAQASALDLEQRCLQSVVRREESLPLPVASSFKEEFTFKTLIFESH